MKRLLILILSFISVNIFANYEHNIEKFIESGDSLLNSNNIINAIEAYHLALNTAENNKDSTYLIIVNNKLAKTYERIGDYNKALDYYTKSYAIGINTNNDEGLANTINYMGNLYILNKNYNKAYELFIKSYNIYKKLNDEKGIAATTNNIGEVYRYKGEYDKALEYYEKAIPINKKMNNKQWLAINYENIGSIYHKKGDLELAEKYYFKALDYAESINDIEGISSINNNLGRLFFDEFLLKKSLKFLNKAYDASLKTSSPEYIKNAAKNLSDVYYTMKDYRRAYRYLKIYFQQKEKIKQASDERQMLALETQLALAKKEKENQLLEQQNKNKNLQMIILAVLFVSLLITAVTIISRIKSKHKQDRKVLKANAERIRAEKALAETEIKNIELAKKNLEQELLYKNKELTNFALHIVHKNDFLQLVKTELKKIKSSNKDTNKQIRDVLIKISQTQELENDLKEFQRNVENANKEFFDRLDKRFPDLTQNERRLAALLHIDLSSKEIASLSNISIKGVEMSRYRLRKKLNIDNNISLTEFFKNL